MVMSSWWEDTLCKRKEVLVQCEVEMPSRAKLKALQP